MSTPVRGQRYRHPAAGRAQPPAERRTRSPQACFGCGRRPGDTAEDAGLRRDLLAEWLTTEDLLRADATDVRHYCAQCQPRGAVYSISCRMCFDGPIITGALAEQVSADEELPPAVAAALTNRGWRPARDGNGWVCCRP